MIGARSVPDVSSWCRNRRRVGPEDLADLARRVGIGRRFDRASPKLPGIRRGRRDWDSETLRADLRAAVEALLGSDYPPSATVAPARQGERAARPAERVVPAHAARVVDAEDRR